MSQKLYLVKTTFAIPVLAASAAEAKRLAALNPSDNYSTRTVGAFKVRDICQMKPHWLGEIPTGESESRTCAMILADAEKEKQKDQMHLFEQGQCDG